MSDVITRFAPSPTGDLHLGGVRTALYNWLWARKNKGKFILRIEDTDFDRSSEESAEIIIQAMQWMGLTWDEGPYYQSERFSLYTDRLHTLKEQGLIYPAFETKEELDQQRERAIRGEGPNVYDRSSLKLSAEEVQKRIAEGMPYVWRFKTPDEGYTEVPELLTGDGKSRFKNSEIGDFVITRPTKGESLGVPLYNFVCAIDDGEMSISHVIRGNEHFTNAAKQILLSQALGYTTPQFVHLPVITKNGKKMSKRDVDVDGKYPVSVLERKDKGYLSEATLNYIALLGWSDDSGKEILELEEMINSFSLSRLNKSNANFDEDKYLHFNTQYIKSIKSADLIDRSSPFFKKTGINLSNYDSGWLTLVFDTVKSRCSLLSEFPEQASYFFEDQLSYEFENTPFSKDPEQSEKVLTTLTENLKDADWNKDAVEAGIKKTIEDMGIKFKDLGPVVRYALSGREQAPSVGDIAFALGKEKTLKRLQESSEHIKKNFKIEKVTKPKPPSLKQ
jgi:glutamyl-tRNA synthetase